MMSQSHVANRIRMIPIGSNTNRLRANAVWYINQEIEPQLYTIVLNIATGGAPVFLP